MGIVYLIISLLLIISFVFIKKSDKKQNLVFWIILSLVMYLVYNVLVAYILSTVKIKCTLVSYTIINVAIIFILWYNIIIKKKIQRYYIKAIDVIVVALLFIITIMVGYKQYGIPLNIKYTTTDPAVHYMAAKEFYENSTLLSNVEKDTLYDFKTFMPASYVNTGMLFKALDSHIEQLDFYKIYIVFDLICLFMIAATFYMLIMKFMKRKIFCIIGALIAILYMLGYPVDILTYGFAYLGMGIMIINAMIAVCKMFEEKQSNIKMCKAVLALLAFGLFFSYYLFMPVVYAAIGIYFILLYKKGKYVISKQAVVTILETLVVPFVLGFIYFILPSILGNGENYGNAIAQEGAIYRNLYGNFIFFIPFVLHYLISGIRAKKISLENIMLVILVGFMLMLFFLGMKDKVSSYYYYKNYYMLWSIVIYIFICELYVLSKRDILLPISIIATYLILVTFTIAEVDKRVYNKSYMWGQENVSSAVTNIYQFNKEKLNKQNITFTNEEMQIIKKLYQEVEMGTPVYIVDSKLEQLWFYSMTGTTSHTSLDGFYDENYIDIDAWNDRKCDYLIYFNTTEYWNKNKEQILKDTTTIFENEYGGIIKNN